MNINKKTKTYNMVLRTENIVLKKENERLKKDNKCLRNFIAKNKEYEKVAKRLGPPIIIGEHNNQSIPLIVEDCEYEKTIPEFKDPIFLSWP